MARPLLMRSPQPPWRRTAVPVLRSLLAWTRPSAFRPASDAPPESPSLLARLKQTPSKSSSSQHLAQLLASMPQEGRFHPAKPDRLPRPHRGDEPPLPDLAFQVLGHGLDGGGSRALLLYARQRLYLFNCPEGVQRQLLGQLSPRALARLRHVFLAGLPWRHLGGLPGLCLTLRKSGADHLYVHGPANATALFDPRNFVVNITNFEVRHHEDRRYENEPVTTRAVPLNYQGHPSDSQPAKLRYTVKNWTAEQLVKKVSHDPRFRSDDLMAEKRDSNWQKGPIDRTVFSYVVDIRDSPRDKPVRCFLVNCPSANYVTALESSSAFNGPAGQEASLVFHFTPQRVLATPEYQQWMSQFSAGSVRHIVLNETNKTLGSDSAIRYARQLKAVAPALFPDMSSSDGDNSCGEANGPRQIHAANGLQVLFRTADNPNLTVSREKVCHFGRSVREPRENGLVPVELEKALQVAHKRMVLDETKPPYPKVTFLGTGSSMPDKYRNVSAILIETRPDSFVILDCGDGTLHQLEIAFGPEKTTEILSNLKAIYISHLHPDHHLGLISLLKARNDAVEADPAKHLLYLLAPGRIAHFLAYYHHQFDSVLTNAYLVKNEHLLPVGQDTVPCLYPSVLRDVLEHCSLAQLVTCRADHCPGSFCVSLTTRDNYKIVYSGDTLPNPHLVDLGRMDRPTDLLIHEATTQHSRLAHAKMQSHSTFADAVECGQAMRAEFTVLTHFSQFYRRMPPCDDFRDKENVAVAFDLMTVTPQTLDFSAAMLPLLEKMFGKKRRAQTLEESLVNPKKSGVTFAELSLR